MDFRILHKHTGEILADFGGELRDLFDTCEQAVAHIFKHGGPDHPVIVESDTGDRLAYDPADQFVDGTNITLVATRPFDPAVDAQATKIAQDLKDEQTATTKAPDAPKADPVVGTGDAPAPAAPVQAAVDAPGT